MSDTIAALRPGDVVTYEPESRWCHDGWAIAEARGDGRIVLVDTYWISGGHVVNPTECEVQFNLADYTEIQYRQEWEKYAGDDREAIPRHGGYQTILLIRNGARPDLATQIGNAREAVIDAEQKVRSAQWWLEACQRDLAQLEARQ